MAGAAQVLPFSFLGKKHAEKLKNLSTGRTSEPLGTRFGWEIVSREPLSQKDVSETLKHSFLLKTRGEAEKKVLDEARLTKVNWSGEEQRGE